MTPVSRDVLVKRINRQLAAQRERLRKARRSRRRPSTVGEFYIVDVDRNFVVAQHVDVERLARSLGVIYGAEVVADD